MLMLWIHIKERGGIKAGRGDTMLKVMAMFCTYFRQLIPINTALEISLHGMGSTTIHVSARALYMHTTRFITEAVYARA